MTDATKDRMTQYEEALVGGYTHWEWHFGPFEGEDDAAVLFFMDVEYDPVRVTYDIEGFARINADGHKWHLFSAEQLRRLADKIDELNEKVDDWRDGDSPEIDAAWGRRDELD